MIELLEKKELEVPFIEVTLFPSHKEAISEQQGETSVGIINDFFNSPKSSKKVTLNSESKFFIPLSASVFKSVDNFGTASISFSILKEGLDVFFKLVEEGNFISLKLGYVDADGKTENIKNSIAFSGFTDIPSVECTENGEIFVTVTANETLYTFKKLVRTKTTYGETSTLESVLNLLSKKYAQVAKIDFISNLPGDLKKQKLMGLNFRGGTATILVQNNLTDLDYLKNVLAVFNYDIRLELDGKLEYKAVYSSLDKQQNGDYVSLTPEEVIIGNWLNSQTNVRKINFSGKDSSKEGDFVTEIDENGKSKIKDIQVYTEEGIEIWKFSDAKMRQYISKNPKNELGEIGLANEVIKAAASMSQLELRKTFFEKIESSKTNAAQAKEDKNITFGPLGLKASVEFLYGQPNIEVNQKICFAGEVPTRWAVKLKQENKEVSFSNIQQKSLWNITNISHSISPEGFVTEVECIR